ncbi:MAG TPA: ferritin [Nitrospirota bacterium]|jgi:rubrerythrin
MINFHRCLICGEVLMGEILTSHCPFCGAKAVHLVPANEWADENIAMGELSAISRANLLHALQLEANNAPFYRNVSAKTADMELQGVFKILAKIEAEHASVIMKILKCALPAPEPGADKAENDDLANLRRSHELEKEAVAIYSQASIDAVEPRVKKVFTALSQVETDHRFVEERLIKARSAKPV